MTTTAHRLTDEEALTRIADLLDGREWDGADHFDAIAHLVRRSGRPVRDPLEIKVHCPTCDGIHVTVCYEAAVSVRVMADRVRTIVVGGFAGGEPVRLYCHDCDGEYDLGPADRVAAAMSEELGTSLAASQVGEPEPRVAEALAAVTALVPDRYQAEVVLEAEGQPFALTTEEVAS